MEGDSRASLELGYFIDGDDAKYFSGLSTILVATIQEVKDRISQIEYIFCSQLFPNFQSRSENLQKKFGEAMKAAEDGWKKKENCLLLQIKELQLEKQKAFEQSQQLLCSLEQVKPKLANDEARKAAEAEWKRKESRFLLQILELRQEKLQALEEKSCLVASLEQEKAKLANDEARKAAEAELKRKESRFLLQILELRQEKHQALEEKSCLAASLEQEKAKLKINEQLLNEHETEKKLLLAKLERLDKNAEVSELQGKLKEKIGEVADGKKTLLKLHQRMELKDYEMLIEKKKRRDLVESYKRLKSQYNFVCGKLGLNSENVLPDSKMEEQSNSPRIHNNAGPEDKHIKTSGPTSLRNEPKDEANLQITMQENEGDRLSKGANSDSTVKSPSASSSSRPLNSPTSVKSEPLAGVKRPKSCWRDTRLRKEPGKADPHDDFLDTPIENIRENLNKTLKEEAQDFPAPAPAMKNMDFDGSDDETQNLNGETVPQKQHHISITRPEDKGFKYIDSVRKKADRECLKGFECKECKKFYDAVLPQGKDGLKNNNSNNNFRCEHHDGVSRHRYRYAPPMTPEGFWNIGFDSDP